VSINKAKAKGIELSYFDQLPDLMELRHGKLWEKFKRCQRHVPVMEPAEGEFRYYVGVHDHSSRFQ